MKTNKHKYRKRTIKIWQTMGIYWNKPKGEESPRCSNPKCPGCRNPRRVLKGKDRLTRQEKMANDTCTDE